MSKILNVEIPPSRSRSRFEKNKQLIHISECSSNITWWCWFVTCLFVFAFSMGWKYQTVAAWFCIVLPFLFSTERVRLPYSGSPTHLGPCLRGPRWFGVLEHPLVALLPRVALHQGKGVAPHSKAPSGAGGDRGSLSDEKLKHLFPLLCTSIWDSSS